MEVAFKACDAQGLENAKPEDLHGIEISPSGLGLHFPALDADLYLPALLNGFLGSRRLSLSSAETLMAVIERVQLDEEEIHSAQAVRAALDHD